MEVGWRAERDWIREQTVRERGEWERKEEERCWEVEKLKARIAGLEEQALILHNPFAFWESSMSHC